MRRLFLPLGSIRFLVFLLCLTFLCIPSAAAQGPIPDSDKAAEQKITPAIRPALAKEGRAEFLVLLTDQADLSGADALPNRAAKAKYVYDQLRQTAERSQ